jgi:hypothetical protein
MSNVVSNIKQESDKKNTVVSIASIMDNNSLDNYSIGRIIYGLFHIIMVGIALILSIRCNNKEFNLGSFIVALFFPYIYIIYILATKNLRDQCDI